MTANEHVGVKKYRIKTLDIKIEGEDYVLANIYTVKAYIFRTSDWDDKPEDLLMGVYRAFSHNGASIYSCQFGGVNDGDYIVQRERDDEECWYPVPAIIFVNRFELIEEKEK